MQAPGSFGLIAGGAGMLALAIALGVIIGAPILAVPFVIVGMGIFLVWRGKDRARTTAANPYRADLDRVPSTEETAADPARDSGVPDATRSGSDGAHRANLPRV